MGRAMREWARYGDTVAPSMRKSDARVLAAVRQAFLDHGFDSDEADVRANATFPAGIGFLHLSGSRPSSRGAVGRERRAHRCGCADHRRGQVADIYAGPAPGAALHDADTYRWPVKRRGSLSATAPSPSGSTLVIAPTSPRTPAHRATPGHTRRLAEAIGHHDEEMHETLGANHYYWSTDQRDRLRQAVGVVTDWLHRHGFSQ